MLFSDYSSAFDIIVSSKFRDLGGNNGTEPLWLDPELPDGQTPGCVDRQRHILQSDSQLRCPSRLCAQPSPVLPVHARLRDYPELQHQDQFCWRHSHEMRRSTETRSEVRARTTTSISTLAKQRRWLWATENYREWDTPSPSRGLQWRESAASGSLGYTSTRTWPGLTTATPSQGQQDNDSSPHA